MTLPAVPDQPRKRIPKKVKGAIDALINGDAKNIAKAAERQGCSRAYLSRELGRPHVSAYFKDRVAKAVALTSGRAAARLAELIDDPRSSHVALEASKFALGAIGVKPSADNSMNINLTIKAGYIIDLSEPGEQPMKVVSSEPAALVVPSDE